MPGMREGLICQPLAYFCVGLVIIPEGYAAGKEKAYFEVLASLEGTPHAEGCACLPCQLKRARLQKVMTLMARSSPGIFELVEAWALED